MSADRPHDVAFSFAGEDSWLAKDLATILKCYNLDVYSFLELPDQASGYIRTRLRQFYSTSRLNILIWSKAYADKPKESIPAMERRELVNRHVDMGDDKTLFIVGADDAPFGDDFQRALVHRVHQHGVIGLETLILARLRSLSVGQDKDGMVCHPQNIADRGGLTPCAFQIDPNFKQNGRVRWESLADILTTYKRPNAMPDVYLIPSGGAPDLLRHSRRLRTDPELLAMKREASLAFTAQYAGREINGFWFAIRKDTIDVIAVYSAVYDACLNEYFRKM